MGLGLEDYDLVGVESCADYFEVGIYTGNGELVSW